MKIKITYKVNDNVKVTTYINHFVDDAEDDDIKNKVKDIILNALGVTNIEWETMEE